MISKSSKFDWCEISKIVRQSNSICWAPQKIKLRGFKSLMRNVATIRERNWSLEFIRRSLSILKVLRPVIKFTSFDRFISEAELFTIKPYFDEQKYEKKNNELVCISMLLTREGMHIDLRSAERIQREARVPHTPTQCKFKIVPLYKVPIKKRIFEALLDLDLVETSFVVVSFNTPLIWNEPLLLRLSPGLHIELHK